MNRKKWLILICALFLLAATVFCGCMTAHIIRSVEEPSLRWTMIGAIGSWAGSIFGAIALVISLFALWLPQKVKLMVSMSSGMMISQAPDVDRIDAYIITVKNIGMRAVTIKNVYLNFGGKKKSNIWVGMLNQGSPLQLYTPEFPKRLESGESFDYYLWRDKLLDGLRHYEKDTPRNIKFYVCVDEVTTGQKYHKTTWTLKTFIGE